MQVFTDKTTMTNRKHKTTIIKHIALSLLILFLLWIATDLIVSNTLITTSKHSVQSDKITSEVRLVVITDLHQKSFGKDNARLIKKVKKQNPDLILTVGDLIEKNADSDEACAYLEELISTLSEIAPVYSCLGNQERYSTYRQMYEVAMTSAGAKLLELSTEEVSVNGSKIRLGGLSYYRTWDEEANTYMQDFVSKSSDSFTLLLCHHPELYLWGIRDYSFDLMVSGHTHGGMIRLPFVGALHAPEQGRFPKYAGGFYDVGTGHLAVCKGLGSSPEYVPRFHNPPEIMVIDLL